MDSQVERMCGKAGAGGPGEDQVKQQLVDQVTDSATQGSREIKPQTSD